MMLGAGVILPDSVDVDRSSSASNEEEYERRECLDTMDWTESKRVFGAGRRSCSSFRGTIIGWNAEKAKRKDGGIRLVVQWFRWFSG